jgi:hypothetical protein
MTLIVNLAQRAGMKSWTHCYEYHQSSMVRETLNSKGGGTSMEENPRGDLDHRLKSGCGMVSSVHFSLVLPVPL